MNNWESSPKRAFTKRADADRQPGRYQLDPGPRRDFAARILALLEDDGMPYAVLRNPQRLLHEGKGDLDLWMPAKSFQSATDLIEREAEAAQWLLLKSVRRPYVCSLYFYKPGRPASALTVDIFPAVRWLVADLVPEELLAQSRVRRGRVWIIEPEVSSLAACLHHLAWNGTIPRRYLAAHLQDGASGNLRHSRLVQRIAEDPAPRWKRSRRRLLISAAAATVALHPIRTFEDLLRTVASLGQSPPGKWLAFSGALADAYLKELDRRLHEEHFMVGRWGSIDRIPSGVFARRAWYVWKVLFKRLLGGMVLSSGEPAKLKPDARVQAFDSGWQAETSTNGPSAHGEDFEDLFEYVLVWLASESRAEASSSGGNANS
jgi:hypothetical protein